MKIHKLNQRGLQFKTYHPTINSIEQNRGHKTNPMSKGRPKLKPMMKSNMLIESLRNMCKYI